MLMTIGLGPSIVNHLEVLNGKVLPPPALGVDIEHGMQAYHQYAPMQTCHKAHLHKAGVGPVQSPSWAHILPPGGSPKPIGIVEMSGHM